MGSSATDGPVVDADGVTFVLADRSRRLAAVRLLDEVGLDRPRFARTVTGWSLRVRRPAVDRMEYRFEVTDRTGRSTITDPANPRTAPGAFGPKSVVEFPGYRAPAWLDAPRADGSRTPIRAAGLTGELWSAEGLAPDEPAPLLVVHDGPEYDRLGGFIGFVAAAVHGGGVPPLRVALLAPGDRNAWYSANDAYAADLARRVLPALPPASSRVGVGVSLGALAMLHAHVRHDLFDALLLQSGSFFTPRLDPQERDFDGFAAVTSFVATLPASTARATAAVLTCGEVEENLANNRAMATALAALGYDATLRTLRDAHNFTAWRDALERCLPAAVASAGAAHAA